MVIASFGRAGAEQGLAVVAAEQEDEPVQVLAQLADVVCGVADELFLARGHGVNAVELLNGVGL
jgi:hypothetical protein